MAFCFLVTLHMQHTFWPNVFKQPVYIVFFFCCIKGIVKSLLALRIIYSDIPITISISTKTRRLLHNLKNSLPLMR